MPLAVLFDLDDTLVDQESAARDAVLHWAAQRGVAEAPDDTAARWSLVSERHYRRYQLRELTFEEQRRARVREFLPGEDLAADDAADRAFGEYLALYEAAWTVFPDAVPTLRRARGAGLAVGILTNGDHAHQTLKLELMGLTDEVDRLVSSSTLSAAKPEPAAFREACALLDVDPGQTLMVGNSLEHDVHGALAAGLEAVLLDRHDAHPDAGVTRVRGLDEIEF